MEFTMGGDARGEFLTVQCADARTFTIDVGDLHLLGEFAWKIHTTSSSRCRYVARYARGKTILLHREIMQPPKTLTVDHEDGNGLNDRRYNLRLATMQQNLSNVHVPSLGATSSGYRGVYDQGNGRYETIISLGGKRYYLGTFTDPIEAAHVWDTAAVAYRGEFTQLNFPKPASVVD